MVYYLKILSFLILNNKLNTQRYITIYSYLQIEIDYMLEKKNQEIASRDRITGTLTEEDEKHLDASMNHNDSLLMLLARM